jgi:hypothetical protein
MGYLFGQKRRKVGRLQRQAARCFLVTQEADSVELGTWCWPRVVLIEKRPLTESERSSMNRAARSVGARSGPAPQPRRNPATRIQLLRIAPSRRVARTSS